MNIHLNVARVRIAAKARSMQEVKTQWEGPMIEVSGHPSGAMRGDPHVHCENLIIRIHKPDPDESQDPRRWTTDAKRIHAWMIWNLPYETYKQLWKLISQEDHNK